MRKFKFLPFLGVALLAAPLAACNQSEEKVTILRVLNMEDYIYVQDEKNGYTADDLTDQFSAYIAADEALSEKYGRVEVIYDTTDTNETLYSEMQTGKALYDLICPSDYMIQKLIASDMIVPLDKSLVPNYFGTEESGYTDSKASRVIKDIFDNIDGHIIKDDKDVKLKDYAVGYMWGTLGILFNPEYSTFADREYSKDEVIADMNTWDVLWNEKYNNTISVKDSMRDTYAVGVVHTYLEEIQAAREAYEEVRNSGTASEEAIEEALAEFKEKFDTIFNRSEVENVEAVEQELNKLKDNVFGLEVDSGKQDIITDKIGINLAWSGDAVYSMDQGEDGKQVGENTKELYYSVPQDGSNLWFDAWVMPKLKEGERSEEQFELAHEFLNFLCEPENVAQNMNYIGYTSFMGGDATLELVRDWFDARTDEIYQEVEVEKYTYEYYDIYVKLEDGSFSEDCLDYPDCMSATHNAELDECDLYYFVPGETEEDPGEYLPVYILDEEENETDVIKKYGDLVIADDYFADLEACEKVNDGVYYYSDEEISIYRVDLSHYFVDTLTEYEDEDMYYYTYTYYAVDEEGNISDSVGRQFYCQYPDMETLNRCSVMKDYGKNNEQVMKMWERFKSNSLPIWAIILFIVEVAVLVGLVVYFLSARFIKKSLRMKRINSQE